MSVSFDNLIALIPEKGKGCVTAKSLSKTLKLQEARIRKMIHEARSHGIPICSTTNGYYFSDDLVDIENTVRFLTQRINTQLRAINGLRKHYE